MAPTAKDMLKGGQHLLVTCFRAFLKKEIATSPFYRKHFMQSKMLRALLSSLS